MFSLRASSVQHLRNFFCSGTHAECFCICCRELLLNNNLLRVLPYELGRLFQLQTLGLKGELFPVPYSYKFSGILREAGLKTFLYYLKVFLQVILNIKLVAEMIGQLGKQCFSSLMLLNFLRSSFQICSEGNKPFDLLSEFVCSHCGRFALDGKLQKRQAADPPTVVLCCWQAILYPKIFSASTRIQTEPESY